MQVIADQRSRLIRTRIRIPNRTDQGSRLRIDRIAVDSPLEVHLKMANGPRRAGVELAVGRPDRIANFRQRKVSLPSQ